MIYLSKQSGFDIKVDNIDHELILVDSVKYDDVLEGTLDYIRPCLLNDELDVPIHLYRIYRNLHNEGELSISPKNDFRYDLLLMPPNVMGIEYVKTHGHRSPKVSGSALTYPQVIEILYGGGTFLMQKYNEEYDPLLGDQPEIENVFMVKAQKGSKVVVPPNYAYTLINTRNTYLITGRLKYVWEEPSLRERLENKHGFSYYVIRKNARQEIVMNPRYKNTPRLKKVKPEDLSKLVGLRSRKPLTTLFRTNPENFEWLKKPSKVEWKVKDK